MKDTVLIVDDSPDTLSMVNAALDKVGIMTLVALEGEQAISIAQRMKPDIILLDCTMPGMDGFEVCIKLKQYPELRSIPIIFMTGLSDTEYIVKGFEAGAVDYVTKPINTAELIARIHTHLTNARVTDSAQSELDNAGKHLFGIDRLGNLQWSTQQVNQLLEESHAGVDWLEKDFKHMIIKWLENSPPVGTVFSLAAPKQALRLVYHGSQKNREHVFGLLEADSAQEVTILKDKLKLTAREAEVLLWVSRGKTNREIAAILDASPRTINKHTENIYGKLNVDNRTAATAKALSVIFT